MKKILLPQIAKVTPKEVLELLKDLYDKEGIVSSKEWYKKHQNRPELAKESHTKNKKVLLKNISDERLKKFKKENKDIKKVVFIEEIFILVLDNGMAIKYVKDNLKNAK